MVGDNYVLTYPSKGFVVSESKITIFKPDMTVNGDQLSCRTDMTFIKLCRKNEDIK